MAELSKDQLDRLRDIIPHIDTYSWTVQSDLWLCFNYGMKLGVIKGIQLQKEIDKLCPGCGGKIIGQHFCPGRNKESISYSYKNDYSKPKEVITTDSKVNWKQIDEIIEKNDSLLRRLSNK